MLFIDLTKLDVINLDNYESYETTVNWDPNIAAAKNKAEVEKPIAELLSHNGMKPIKYIININTQKLMTVDDIIGCINILTAVFFDWFVLTGGRKRERRLDIPEKLQDAHISAGLLKRAINTSTVTDIFNLEINFNTGNVRYVLIDTKEATHE